MANVTITDLPVLTIMNDADVIPVVNVGTNTTQQISGADLKTYFGAGLPLANGTSNINIATANGNVTVTSAGNTWNFGTTGNLTAPGNVTATGNVTGGNILTAGLITATGNISGGNANITATTASTSRTTGALRVAGGVGVAGAVNVGTSVTIDGGAYGNVVTTQFASVFASGSGPNPRSIMQVRGADGVAGIGIQGQSGGPGQVYANANIIFTTGATLRDKDFPTGGTTRATLDSTGLSVVGTVTTTGVITTPVALSTLTAVAGARAFVNDGNLAASSNFGVQIGSGGSNVVSVWSDGAVWYIG